MCEYVEAGDFTIIGRLRTMLRRFLIFNSVFAILFTIFLIYMWAQKAFDSNSFLGFIIALSNAWGLFQIIIFLGYGIVSVP